MTQPDDTMLMRASRCIQVAWKVIFATLGAPLLEESMLLTSRTSSSSCTGAYTGEMSLAAVQKTVNSSCDLDRPVNIRGHRVFSEEVFFFLKVFFF